MGRETFTSAREISRSLSDRGATRLYHYSEEEMRARAQIWAMEDPVHGQDRFNAALSGWKRSLRSHAAAETRKIRGDILFQKTSPILVDRTPAPSAASLPSPTLWDEINERRRQKREKGLVKRAQNLWERITRKDQMPQLKNETPHISLLPKTNGEPSNIPAERSWMRRNGRRIALTAGSIGVGAGAIALTIAIGAHRRDNSSAVVIQRLPTLAGAIHGEVAAQKFTTRTVTIESGQTIGQLEAPEIPDFWKKPSALKTLVELNYTELKTMSKNVKGPDFYFPSLEELTVLQERAENGDTDAMETLRECLHYVRYGVEVHILTLDNGQEAIVGKRN